MDKPYWNVFRTPDEANSQWQKVGVAFLNKDGSYNLRLKAPVTPADKLQMREARMKEKSQAQTKEPGVEAELA